MQNFYFLLRKDKDMRLTSRVAKLTFIDIYKERFSGVGGNPVDESNNYLVFFKPEENATNDIKKIKTICKNSETCPDFFLARIKANKLSELSEMSNSSEINVVNKKEMDSDIQILIPQSESPGSK